MIIKKFLALFLSLTITVLISVSAAQAQEAHAALINPQPSHSFPVPSDLTDEEKHWFVKFQKGNLFVDGWQDISASILKKTPDAQKKQQREMLEKLGQKIGLEWCRDNNIRKVDTSMLKDWGKELKRTVKDNPKGLNILLVSINEQIDTL